jgi:hypothetical protein
MPEINTGVYLFYQAQFGFDRKKKQAVCFCVLMKVFKAEMETAHKKERRKLPCAPVKLCSFRESRDGS